MRNSIIYLTLFLIAGLNTAVMAQDKEEKNDKPKGPDLEMAIEMTKTIIDISAPLGITVHDHIIIAREGHASLKGMQLI